MRKKKENRASNLLSLLRRGNKKIRDIIKQNN